MSTSFSANQYQNAFVPRRLQNWEVPMEHRENTWMNMEESKKMYAKPFQANIPDHPRGGIDRPKTPDFDPYSSEPENPAQPQGFTEVIANDRGHIMEGIPRSSKNPWGDFVGTWDLPKKIPGNCARVQTARADLAADRLQREQQDANVVLRGTAKNMSRTNKNEFPLADMNKSRSSVTLQPDPERRGYSSKQYPKTPYPKPEEYRNLTPVSPSNSPQAGIVASPAPVTSPAPRMSPDPASPVGLPTDRRSPTPPEKSPIPAHPEGPVMAL